MPLWTKHDLMLACKGKDPTSNFLDNFENIHGISIEELLLELPVVPAKLVLTTFYQMH